MTLSETSDFPPSHSSGRDLIARAIIIHDERLLVNHGTARDGSRYFALPGGHVDPGENCIQALEREFREELEAEIEAGDLRFVSEMIYGAPPRHELVLFFDARITQPPREADGRVLSPEPRKDFCWLPLSQLREVKLVPPALRDFLEGETGARYRFEAQPGA